MAARGVHLVLLAAAVALAYPPGAAAPWPTDLLSQLGGSGYTGYVPEDDGCKIALVDQPDVELKCVGNEGHVPNETIVDGQTYCGGIPLKKGLCLVPAHGTFTKTDSSQVSEALLLRRSVAEPLKPSQKWCSSVAEFESGKFVGNVEERDNQGRYVGDDAEFLTEDCRSLPLNQEALLKAFPNKRLFMMGDSHIRNMFTSLAAGVREQETFAETHGFHGLFHYAVGEDRDLWRMVDPTRIDGIVPDVKHVERAPWAEGPVFTPCSEQGLGATCVDVVFLWATQFADQTRAIKGVMELLEPEVVLTSISNYERTRAMDSSWLHMWDEALKNAPQVESFMFMVWPFGNPMAKPREAAVKKWYTEGDRPYRTHFLDMSIITEKLNTKQIKYTWHDVCSVRDNWPKVAYGIEAYGACTAPFSRTLLRIWLTLAGPLEGGGGGAPAAGAAGAPSATEAAGAAAEKAVPVGASTPEEAPSAVEADTTKETPPETLAAGGAVDEPAAKEAAPEATAPVGDPAAAAATAEKEAAPEAAAPVAVVTPTEVEANAAGPAQSSGPAPEATILDEEASTAAAEATVAEELTAAKGGGEAESSTTATTRKLLLR